MLGVTLLEGCLARRHHTTRTQTWYTIQQPLCVCSSQSYYIALVYTRPSSRVRCGVGSGPGLGPEFESADAPDLVWGASGTALSPRTCDDSGPTLDSD